MKVKKPFASDTCVSVTDWLIADPVALPELRTDPGTHSVPFHTRAWPAVGAVDETLASSSMFDEARSTPGAVWMSADR